MKDVIIQFYEKYADYAYRVALVRTNNKADAEDLSQEVVLNIIKNQVILNELIKKDESQAKGYLAKAVVNMTIEQYKKSSSRLKRENAFANTKMVVVDEPEPEPTSNIDEHKHAILKAVKDLPEKYQTIIMLKFFEGHSNSELSDILNVKEVSIRSLISRAIQKLKSQLKASSISLSIASITLNLETTQLVSAPPEFKTKITQMIHENYKAVPLTSGSAIYYKVISFLFFGVFTSFVLYKYGLPFFNKPQISEQITNTSENKPIHTPTVLDQKPLYKFDLNMKDVTSKAELNKLVNSILDIKDNKNFLISFEKKGITTVGQDLQSFNLPYTLELGKALVVSFEAKILSSKGTKLSAVGLGLKIFTPHTYTANLFENDDPIYKIKYTILDKALFAESNLFDGIRSYEIEDSEFQNKLSINSRNAIIRRITLYEMDEKEIKTFKEKNASLIQEIEAYIKSEN